MFTWLALSILPVSAHSLTIVELGIVRIASLGMMAYDLNPRDPYERIVWLAKLSKPAYIYE